MILRATAMDPAILLAERLRKLIEQTTVHHNDTRLSATASIGVAGYPATDAESIEQLIEAADRALYSAKAAGRNKVSHDTICRP